VSTRPASCGPAPAAKATLDLVGIHVVRQSRQTGLPRPSDGRPNTELSCEAPFWLGFVSFNSLLDGAATYS
jgi:hypothetical protein